MSLVFVFSGDLGQHVARVYRVAVLNHKVSPRRHQVSLARLALDYDGRLALLVRRIRNHVTRQTSDFVDFFVERDAFLQVLELRRTANFSKDGERVRIPLDKCLAERNRSAFRYFHLGAVYNCIAFAFATLFVHDCD